MSRQAVTKWESGQTVPSTENLMALASIYGISLDELAADKKAGGADDRKILHTNLTLIAIILQASFLNAAIQPSQVRETDPPFMKTMELAIKFLRLPSGWPEISGMKRMPPSIRKTPGLSFCTV